MLPARAASSQGQPSRGKGHRRHGIHAREDALWSMLAQLLPPPEASPLVRCVPVRPRRTRTVLHGKSASCKVSFGKGQFGKNRDASRPQLAPIHPCAPCAATHAFLHRAGVMRPRTPMLPRAHAISPPARPAPWRGRAWAGGNGNCCGPKAASYRGGTLPVSAITEQPGSNRRPCAATSAHRERSDSFVKNAVQRCYNCLLYLRPRRECRILTSKSGTRQVRAARPFWSFPM
jgi:hypothetical protein